MAKIEASRPSKKSVKRKVTHIRITKAANGFTVHHSLERPPASKGKRMMQSFPSYEPDPKPAVFETQDAAQDHVGNLMGQMGGDEPGAPDAS